MMSMPSQVQPAHRRKRERCEMDFVLQRRRERDMQKQTREFVLGNRDKTREFVLVRVNQ